MNHPTENADATAYGPPNAFDQNALKALGDEQLHSALRNLVVTFGGKRQAAISSVDDWEGLRDDARAIKDETLAHLDRYLEEFAENAERAGGRVHWARNGSEVSKIIIELLQARHAKRVVKSKSMATEEIHLNAG